MGLVPTILLLFSIMVLTGLLITAYVVTPIVSWLAVNPLGGVALLVVNIVLASILFREQMKNQKKSG